MTGQMQEMTDHRILEALDQIRNAKFTLQMDFSDMMTEYLLLLHGQSLTQLLLRDMSKLGSIILAKEIRSSVLGVILTKKNGRAMTYQWKSIKSILHTVPLF